MFVDSSHRRGLRRAFTLIELLVVITIIVVLLAMLSPALDKAIYSAELVTCSAKLKVIATGMAVYSVDHKRWLPYNHKLATKQTTQAVVVAHDGSGLDMRPILRPYMSINKTLVDPMIPAYEIENSKEESIKGVPADVRWKTVIHSTYSLWNGWAWTSGGSAVTRNQNKIGDRMHYQALGGTGPEYRWDILAGDFMRAPTTYGGWASHPSPGKDTMIIVTGEPSNYGVWRFWASIPVERDEVDYNVARQDGSVQTSGNVKWNDDRMIYPPEFNTGVNPERHQLPKP